MNRRQICVAAALSLACGCGDSGSGAGPDAASLKGSWKMVSQTIGGTATPAAQVDGALVLGDTDFALASATPLGGTLTTYTLSGDGKALTLGSGGTVTVALTAEPRLTLTLPGDRKATFAPDNAPRLSTYTVQGTVTAPAPMPAYKAPRVALAFLERDINTGETKFINEDARFDMPLSFSGGTATFSFVLERDALGTQRIVFGPLSVGIAVALVAIYDDRNQSQRLDELFQPCSASTTDCVLGVSPIVLGYRESMSAQLAASPYAYLREGWSNAVQVTDGRRGGSKAGLVSLDGSTTLPFDVTLPADPGTVTVTKFDLTVPAVP